MPNTPTPAIETKFAMPDPGQAPLNLVQLFTLANALVSSTIQGAYLSYMVQHSEPGASDRDKVWIVTDTQGRPTDIKIWWNTSGSWRRVYNGMMGEIRGFSGDPTVYFNNDGLGILGGAYDGWHICNGKDGTPDYSNRFLAGASMNPPDGTPLGYDPEEGWRTLIDDKVYNEGGQWTEKLQAKNVPLPLLEQTTMTRYKITPGGGETVDATGPLWGIKASGNQHRIPGYPDDQYTYPPDGYKGNPDPEGVFTGPPFFSAAWIIFVGYYT